MNNNNPRDWQDSVIIGSLIAGSIIIATILLVRSQPQSQSTITASNFTSSNISTPQQLVQKAAINSVLPKMEAVAIINSYLSQKDRIYAPPYDRQLASTILTGNVYYDLTKPNGVIDWLEQNNAYYRYGSRKAEPLAFYTSTSEIAQIEVKVTQELSFFKKDVLQDNKPSIKDYKFSLKLENGIWKISDIQDKFQ